jgi:hypothetical protein
MYSKGEEEVVVAVVAVAGEAVEVGVVAALSNQEQSNCW